MTFIDARLRSNGRTRWCRRITTAPLCRRCPSTPRQVHDTDAGTWVLRCGSGLLILGMLMDLVLRC